MNVDLKFTKLEVSLIPDEYKNVMLVKKEVLKILKTQRSGH